MDAKWTIMVYLAGNNSLSDAADNDLAEMQSVGSTEAVKVLAFVKQKQTAARHLVIGKGGFLSEESLPAGTDSGDPQTVVNFARWAIEKAPADRYGLVIWNHGGGWAPDDFDQLYQQVRSKYPRAPHEVNRLAKGKLTRAVFKTTIERVLALPNMAQRAIANDDVTGHSLDTVEVERVLGAVTQAAGKKLELFGMDACLMSTLEVAYQVRDRANVIVGSEELEPGDGWCYDTILAALNQQPTMDGAALGKVIVERYIASYKDRQSEWPVTQCAVRTSAIENLAGKLDALAAALRTQLAKTYQEIFQAQARATSFECDMYDLQSFCKALEQTASTAALKKAAQDVTAALTSTGYVLAEGHLGSKVQNCGGVSVYLPSPLADISPYYKQLSFAEQHKWDDFLSDYRRAVTGD